MGGLRSTDPRNPAPSSLMTRAVMRSNRGRDTGPELAVRQLLWQAGVRGYRTNFRVAGVRPDIVFTRQRLTIFVHGCFWHRCMVCDLPLPASNRAFWVAKFRRNRRRDRKKRQHLEAEGWKVLEFWTHEIEAVGGADRAVRSVAKVLRRPQGRVQRQATPGS